MQSPMVSVICLCYNHERFVEESITSVLKQSYGNIEIIVVDDASTDRSRIIIERIVAANPRIKYYSNTTNIGNCAAFNHGLAMSTGSYVVDFATDDVMLPERIAKQVSLFEKLDESYGVVFTDVVYIDEKGNSLYSHREQLRKRNLIDIPTGDVFANLISSYFISAPSMLVRRSVFTELNGYDESLAYEDFDFWIRSSRNFRYAFIDEVLTKVRKSKASLSAQAYLKGDRQLHSTYLVCRKAFQLIRTENEKYSLLNRVRYEYRHAVFSENYEEAKLFWQLLNELGPPNAKDRFFYKLSLWRLPLAEVRRLYHALRYS